MTIELWFAFVAASAVLLVIPGPTILTVFASSARRLLASPRAQRRLDIVGDSLLSAAGVWALLAKPPA